MTNSGADAEYKPRVRPVEAYPVENEGQKLVLLRDGTGVSENQVVLSPAAFFVVSLLDGTRTLLDVRHEFTRRTGEILFSDVLESLLSKLDESLLMDSPRFHGHMAGLEAAFASAAERPSRLAGRAYDSDAAELCKWLDCVIATGEEDDANARPRGALAALIAPHIDVGRGASSYGAAWRGAAGMKPDRVVILGTAHFGHSDSLYIATKKPFRTPLGASPVDAEALAAIESAAGPRIFDGEYAHAAEHSIEFQVLFAQRLFGPDMPIVPILACSLHEFFGTGKKPSADPRVSSVCSALRSLAADASSRTLIVASADLAHVGLRFGDDRPVDEAFAASVKARDSELIERACELDSDGFFDAIEADRDSTRVCGFPSIYALLLALQGSGAVGVLRDWDIAPDETGSAVSFAGVTFEKRPEA